MKDKISKEQHDICTNIIDNVSYPLGVWMKKRFEGGASIADVRDQIERAMKIVKERK